MNRRLVVMRLGLLFGPIALALLFLCLSFGSTRVHGATRDGCPTVASPAAAASASPMDCR